MKIKIFLTFVMFLLLGCNNESNHVTPKEIKKTPTETYISYHEQAKTNLDFQMESSYYSTEMIERTNLKIDKHIEKMNLTIDEVKSKYMQFISESTVCMDILPVSEVFNSNTVATIKFEVTDICSNHIGAIQKVVMVNEDGWKIDDIELIL